MEAICDRAGQRDARARARRRCISTAAGDELPRFPGLAIRLHVSVRRGAAAVSGDRSARRSSALWDRRRPPCAARWSRPSNMNKTARSLLLRPCSPLLGVAAVPLRSDAAADHERSAESARSASSRSRYEGATCKRDRRATRKVPRKGWTYERLGIARQQQNDHPVHDAGRSQGRGAADSELSGSRSDQWMWTPAINRERRVARAGSPRALLRDRLQLRGPGGARHRAVRLHAAGRGDDRR